MLLTFLAFTAPGGTLIFFMLRFIKQNAQVTVSRTDAARATARMDAARETAAVATETARIALGQTSEALQIARLIEHVDENVDFIVSAINGEQPAQRASGRHKRAMPSADGRPAIRMMDETRYLP